jgi:hypothetical protein
LCLFVESDGVVGYRSSFGSNSNLKIRIFSTRIQNKRIKKTLERKVDADLPFEEVERVCSFEVESLCG